MRCGSRYVSYRFYPDWINMLKVAITATLLFMLGCKSTKPAPTFGGGSEHLYAHQWTLVEVDGRPVTPAETEKDAHLLFSTPNRLTGSTGCNRLTGTFELAGENGIRFSPLATTRMMCPNADDESRFVKALGTVDTYNVTDAALLLNNGKTVVVRLQARSVK